MTAPEAEPPSSGTSEPPASTSDAPPGAWPAAHRLIERVARPLERFLHVQASSGVVLLVAAAVALGWANSPWSASYQHIWHVPVGFHLGTLDFSAPLHFIVNEGLMVVFFFLVGLEIRREMHGGELANFRRAALPFFAAVGGMLAPALVYLAVSQFGGVTRGWGIPMATDIAFAVGVLALLGRRVPSGLRVLLLALAIIDDVGAIIVIALFYSSGFDLVGIGVATLGILLVLFLQRLGVRRPLAYTAPGLILWAGLLAAGIHPTIAGVVLGLLTPATAWLGGEVFVETAERAVGQVRSEVEHGTDERQLLEPLKALHRARKEAVSPLVKLEAALHPWVAFGIMPLFAFANAGVNLSSTDASEGARMVTLGVLLGLIIGKPIGIMAGGYLSVRLGLGALPRRVTYQGLFVVGMVSGIGFTMAIFIATLAFSGSEYLAPAKIGVLAASLFSAVLAIAYGQFVLRPPGAGAPPDVSPDEAEQSTQD